MHITYILSLRLIDSAKERRIARARSTPEKIAQVEYVFLGMPSAKKKEMAAGRRPGASGVTPQNYFRRFTWAL